MLIDEGVVGIVGSGFLLSVIFLIGLAVRWRLMYRAAETAHQSVLRQHDLLRSQLAVQTRTLAQTRTEIQDHIGQLLMVAGLNLSGLEDTESPSVYHREINASSELVHHALDELRCLSERLGDGLLPNFDLVQRLEQELRQSQRQRVQRPELYLTGNRYPLGLQTDLVLLRICQELLDQHLSRSADPPLVFSLQYKPDQFRLSVSGITALETVVANLLRPIRLLGGQDQIQPEGNSSRIEIQISRQPGSPDAS